jgi:hypothetical protein
VDGYGKYDYCTPVIVSILGCSLITIHTQKGPMIVSNKKNKLTSSAGINLGAMVTRTKE